MTDPLSDALSAVRLTGGVVLDARFTAPWAVNSVVTAEACRPLLNRPAHLIAYHFVLEGYMLVHVGEQPPITVEAGEIVLIPRNDRQTLASSPGLTPVDGHGLVDWSPGRGLARVNHGGGGAATRMFCGFLGSDDAINPLFQALPSILKIDVREATSRGMLEASLAFAAGELMHGRLASSDVLSRLSEFLLVEAVRRYAATPEGGRIGWIKGLTDPQIGRSLALIHLDFAAPWTTVSLARAVAMSRSVFTARFTAVVGHPPFRYLTYWRMEKAKLELRGSAKSIALIAHAVGYGSEEAFSRAFKRAFGVAPATWRDRRSS
jgi:AraC-like DNA-binding protein